MATSKQPSKALCSEAVSKACLDPVLNLSLVVTPIVALEMKVVSWEERNSEKDVPIAQQMFRSTFGNVTLTLV